MADHRTRELPTRMTTLEGRLAAAGATLHRPGVAVAHAHRGRRPARALRRLLPVALAALLVALIPLATYAANPFFSDLNQAAAVHRDNIQAIGNAGITTGYADPNDPSARLYDPKGLVTREEMASFLARTAGLGANPPVVNALTVPDGSITPAKLGAGGAAPGQVLTATGTGVAFRTPTTNAIVRQAPVTVPAGGGVPLAAPTAASVSCAAGERATGGGHGSATGSYLVASESRPLYDPATNVPTGWTVTLLNVNPNVDAQGTVYAVCAPAP